MRQPVQGVYADLADLASLEWKARGYSFLPRQPIRSLLAGRHASRMRGRGLDFEELRAYVPGDDTRTIDWRVTARMRKPFVRAYREERDHPVILVVDQRQSMFFGSRRAMKSVVAAEIAALGAWRAFRQGDRVGGWVFDDDNFEEVRPHRSRRAVLRLLGRIVEHNHRLAAGRSHRNSGMLNAVLDQVRRQSYHDHVVLVISDFDGANDATRRALLLTHQHNDVIAVPVTDPLRSNLPDRGRVVVSDGALQMELDLAAGRVRTSIQQFLDKSLNRITSWRTDIGVPVLPVSTDEDPAKQLRRLIGAQTAARRNV